MFHFFSSLLKKDSFICIPVFHYMFNSGFRNPMAIGVYLNPDEMPRLHRERIAE